MSKLIVIGVSSQGLNAKQREVLASCKLIVGGKRLLSMVADLSIRTQGVTPLADAMPAIGKALKQGDVGILASGDPLFFGVGRRLLEEFGPAQVEIHPALSSMQEAFARFKQPWDDAKCVSLHGRKSSHVSGLLLKHPKTFVFTDRINSPDQLATQLTSYLELIEDHELLKKCRILVAENLGSKEESLFEGGLQETAGRKFQDLNVICLLCPQDKEKERLGLTEMELAHSRGLITKDEVRAVTLHRLRLPQTGVFWDVGAGSGSVSIEAARLNPGLTIYAIERKNEELANIKKNIRRHGCYNVVPVHGMALDVLGDLPDPQRVFIGGNGGQLSGIIHETTRRLPVGGLLVVNGVIEKTITEAPQLMAARGLSIETTQMNVTRTGQSKEPVAFNPITIMVGVK